MACLRLSFLYSLSYSLSLAYASSRFPVLASSTSPAVFFPGICPVSARF